MTPFAKIYYRIISIAKKIPTSFATSRMVPSSVYLSCTNSAFGRRITRVCSQYFIVSLIRAYHLKNSWQRNFVIIRSNQTFIQRPIKRFHEQNLSLFKFEEILSALQMEKERRNRRQDSTELQKRKQKVIEKYDSFILLRINVL